MEISSICGRVRRWCLARQDSHNFIHTSIELYWRSWVDDSHCLWFAVDNRLGFANFLSWWRLRNRGTPLSWKLVVDSIDQKAYSSRTLVGCSTENPDVSRINILSSIPRWSTCFEDQCWLFRQSQIRIVSHTPMMFCVRFRVTAIPVGIIWRWEGCGW
jgi:hypothetical protein